jgi:hypothetical protein
MVMPTRPPPKFDGKWGTTPLHPHGTKMEGDWHEWFAWHPVTTINGEKVWLKKIVRRKRWFFGYSHLNGYVYGTLFDILK